MQADFFTMEATPPPTPHPHSPCMDSSSSPTYWVVVSFKSSHHQIHWVLSKKPIKTDLSESSDHNVGKKANMIVAVVVSCAQPQRLYVSLVLERQLIPHRHVPQSVITNIRLLQPGCVQPALWYVRSVSQQRSVVNDEINVSRSKNVILVPGLPFIQSSPLSWTSQTVSEMVPQETPSRSAWTASPCMSPRRCLR